MKLKRDILEPNRYEYLDEEDSLLYDSVYGSRKKKDKIIRRLLEEKSASCKGNHCASGLMPGPMR